MSAEPPPLRLLALAGEAERPVMLSAARQLATAVGAALGREWSLRLSFAEADERVGGLAADVAIVSLLADLRSAEPVAAVAARWDRAIADLAARGTRVAVATLYRHVPGERETVERVRRLNALAIDLSRAHGAEVADVDRAFAMMGSATLASGVAGEGERAALVAGQVLAAAVLAANLSACLPADVQDRARAAHGSFAAFVDRQHWPAL